MTRYDIVIIGSGVGFSILDTALQSGMSCAIVENSKFGGTCLTRGCIPSKVLVAPSDIIREAQHAKKIGINLKLESVDWAKIGERMWSRIDKSKKAEENLDNIDGLAVYKGTGEFTGKYKMRVKLKNGEYSEEFTGDRFVIAAGARSFVPPIKGLDDTGYITSETFFGDKFPKKPWDSLVIVGGGAIGAEFAHIFSAMGTKVTIVEMRPHLLSTEEPEVSIFLENIFEENAIDVKTNFKVLSAQKQDGKKLVTIENIKGDTQSISCDEIFIASGVRTNADILKVENTGVETDARGWIVTNEHLETNINNIWALGDINGKFQFRHKANYEAGICEHNIFGGGDKKSADYSAVPWAIFTCPQVAHIGITEAQALEKHDRILVAKKYYSTVAKGYSIGYSWGDSDNGFVKLITDINMKILGVHIVGPHAAILIQSFIHLINSGHTCKASEKKSILNLDENMTCPKHGSFDPVYNSMVIHPSLSELTSWIVGELELVEK